MFIRTPRLFLRPAWHEDAPALARLLSEPSVQSEPGGSAWMETMADADQFLSAPCKPQDVRLLIFRRAADAPRLIGTAGVGRPFARTEFALWLSRTERRHGFAQEAGRAILSLAFDGLRHDSVWTPAYQDGPASRLIARLGFRRASEGATAAVLHASDWTATPPRMAAA